MTPSTKLAIHLEYVIIKFPSCIKKIKIKTLYKAIEKFSRSRNICSNEIQIHFNENNSPNKSFIISLLKVQLSKIVRILNPSFMSSLPNFGHIYTT